MVSYDNATTHTQTPSQQHLLQVSQLKGEAFLSYRADSHPSMASISVPKASNFSHGGYFGATRTLSRMLACCPRFMESHAECKVLTYAIPNSQHLSIACSANIHQPTTRFSVWWTFRKAGEMMVKVITICKLFLWGLQPGLNPEVFRCPSTPGLSYQGEGA